jgi:hypothetical protein
MSANQAFFTIATMARVLGVSTAGYYAAEALDELMKSAHTAVATTG